jgi:hypothetical protein
MVAMIFPSAVSLYTHHTLGNVKWQGLMARASLPGISPHAALPGLVARAHACRPWRAAWASAADACAEPTSYLRHCRLFRPCVKFLCWQSGECCWWGRRGGPLLASLRRRSRG